MKKITGLALIAGFVLVTYGAHYNYPDVGQYMEATQSQIDTDSVHRTIYPPSKRNIYPPDSPPHPNNVIDTDTIRMPADTNWMNDSSFYHK